MRPDKHINRYKQIRKTIEELLSKKVEERDAASICILAHWASYHLISMIIDQLPISDSLKHRNHRGIKRVLLNQEEVKTTLGEKAEELLSIYNKIESNFTVRFQGYHKCYQS